MATSHHHATILEKAEELLGKKVYDPLLLLVLMLDDDSLRTQTAFGEKLLATLQPLFNEAGEDGKKLVVEAAREYARHQLVQDMQWRLDSRHMPAVQYKARKNELLSHQNESCRDALCPSLMQIVYRQVFVMFVYAPQWNLIFKMAAGTSRGSIALHPSGQMPCTQRCWRFSWMNQSFPPIAAACEAPGGPCRYAPVFWFDGTNRCSHVTRLKKWQVIEFPNVFQRIHKFYIDWDKKTSEVAFFDDSSGGSFLQRSAGIERLRLAALGTPAAILRILQTCVPGFALEQDDVRVLVKEGTRNVSSTDCKVSFHFVFQILVTTEQFRAIYQHVVQHIQTNPEMQLLSSVLLNSTGDEDAPKKANMLLDNDKWWSGLLGMDLHPQKNAYQGLACTGSRKNLDAKASSILGTMLVSGDGSSWEWISSPQQVEKPQQDATDESMCSKASTVSSCSHAPLVEKAGLPHKILSWMEASVIMPSPSCIPVKISCSPPVSNTAGVQDAKKRKIPLSVERNLNPEQGTRWRTLVFESMGLQWFREALGGKEETRRMFAQVYTNIQNISKPKEVSEAANNKKNAGCPPWALVHVSCSDACMCSCKLAQVPFQGHKKHQRNGVVFCFFGSRVFVSCMDAECKHSFSLMGRLNHAMAKELERIHLGAYSRDYLQSGLYEKDIQLAMASTSSAFEKASVPSEETRKIQNLVDIARMLSSNPSLLDKNIEFLKSEARKRCASLSDASSMQDLLTCRLIPADCMCHSNSQERMWVEVGKETVLSYTQWLRNANPQQQEQNERVKQRPTKREGPSKIVFSKKGPPLVFLGLNKKKHNSDKQ